MEGYISEIRMFAADFAPRNWSFCNGALLSIAQNTALFSLLGTTYGGNGVQTFGLPDFRSRTALGTGQGAGLSMIDLGEIAGTENVSLMSQQIPAHSHNATGTVSQLSSNSSGDESNPAGGYPANSGGVNLYSANGSSSMGPTSVNLTISPAGNSQPHSNLQPYLAMNYIICLYGIFPSRS